MERATSPSLSAVVPVYNEESWIARSVERILAEIESSPFAIDRVVIVDDGSTDRTPIEADRLAAEHPSVEVVHQQNRGRYLARLAGLERTQGDYVLLVDSRVVLEEGGLSYIAERLSPEASVWNGHVDVRTEGNPFAVFWDTMTRIAWSEYFSNPRLTHFGLERFDNYPKGTGCFLAPRDVLIKAFASFSTYYDDLRNASDDTSLIRDIAGTHEIWIGPGFACSYVSRSTLRQFLTHAFKRGTFFVDGHLRRGARFAPVIVAFYLVSVVGVVAIAFWPMAAAVAVIGTSAAAALLTVAKRQPLRSALTVGALAPIFVGVYGLGIWRGLLLLVRSKLQ